MTLTWHADQRSMSSKTMRPPPPRRGVSGANAISSGNSSGSKRKERVDDGFKRPDAVPTAKLFQPDKQKAEPEMKINGSKPVMMCSNNKLLAGYMAHEFLTKGTLLGRRWGRLPSPRGEPLQHKYERYAGLTQLLKTDGAQIPGIVNPTQLAHFLQLS